MDTIKLQLIILLTFCLSFANQISDKVTLHAEGAPLSSVLAMLADESGYNIVTGANVDEKEKLTIHLTDVQIDQAIKEKGQGDLNKLLNMGQTWEVSK